MAGRLVDYIGSGLAAALPAAATIDAALTPDAAGFFYATDTQTLYCLDRSGTPSWDQIVTGAGGYAPGGTDVALADGGTGASLSDPNADRLMFWDDSAGQVTWLSPGTGLSITGTTLDATGIGLSDGDKGDVTVSSSGTVWTVDNDAITYAKIQNVSAASKLLGRGSAGGAGDVEEITIGTGLSMSGTTLSASGSGSGGTGFIEETATGTTVSTSAFASKGAIVNLTENQTIYGCKCTITTTGTYKLVLAQLNTGTDAISSILGSSPATALTATVNNFAFKLTAPVSASSGDRLAFIIVRTDGTSTSICGLQFPTAVGENGWGFTYYGCVRYASVDPAVSDAVLFSTTSSARMMLVYSI